MSSYKLLALDMDGTVLNAAHEITDTTCQWIGQAVASGITVMFATGREVQSIEGYIRKLGLNSPLVTVNGSEVWSAPGQIMMRHVLQDEWIAELYALASGRHCRYWAYTVNDVFTTRNWPEHVRRPADDPWLKFGLHSDDPAVLADIRDILAKTCRYELTNSSPRNIEVNPLGINKASGLREVCRLLGIRMEEVAACGDSLNDLEMIRAAGLGIAMGNAQEAVKQAADAVTGTNEEDGVAQAIRTYLLDFPETP
ncbi:Cof-type HAD-IIB family hydrolase [Paenibacillus sp. YN15]|uniref:Cof-type HAD-IIB family hydrolase n=1 Tax=Paenibacillus sp. YN15 TaxID=1742774 RepID=UPI000DCF0978|nr:Cof-type HAD-IIB family hydrolase [Paenibacillus sp. YN15]RAV05035.1 phosphoglycolate phosphatase [Paenibacillus sp. YN15]